MILIGVLVLSLLFYWLRNTDENGYYDEEGNVSVCQVRVHFDRSDGFDDQTLLLLLVTLKMHDFIIGQPVWIPSDTLLYLCEHRLKVGFKQSTLDKKLHNVIKNAPVSAGRLAWSCA